MVTDYLMGRMLEKKGDESPLNEKLRLKFDLASDGFGLTPGLADENAFAQS
jgi:hypothetical protein